MIVDASVAIKWLVLEEDSEAANSLLARSDLIAPDFLACEVANAIWRKCEQNELTAVPSGLSQLMGLFGRVEPVHPHIVRATQMAIDLGHPADDCFYLAMAEAFGDELVTADIRLVRRLAGTRYASLVQPLSKQVG